MLAHTKAPAILIELGFIDNDADMEKWNVDKIGNGQSVDTSNGSKYIVTDGLGLEAGHEVSQYLLEHKWWARMEFTTNGDTFVTTGGSMKCSYLSLERG